MKTVQSKLLALTNAYVEKFEEQPYLGMDLTIRNREERAFGIYLCERRSGPRESQNFYGDTVEEVFEEVLAYIASFPDKAVQDRINFQTSLGKLIDQGRDVNIDVDFLNPLTKLAKELSENALEFQAA